MSRYSNGDKRLWQIIDKLAESGLVTEVKAANGNSKHTRFRKAADFYDFGAKFGAPETAFQLSAYWGRLN